MTTSEILEAANRLKRLHSGASHKAVYGRGGPGGRMDEERDMCEILHQFESLTMYAAALTAGLIRWEPTTREICVSGLRYSTQLDESGVPHIHDVVRLAIVKAMSERVPA